MVLHAPPHPSACPFIPRVVKSVPVALSSRKPCNMSNGSRGDNVRRAGSKSHFCSSPLIHRFHLRSRLTDDTVCGPGCISVPGSFIASRSDKWLCPGVAHPAAYTVNHRGRTTVQQQPVEDSRAIIKLEVTSVSPEVTKE